MINLYTTWLGMPGNSNVHCPAVAEILQAGARPVLQTYELVPNACNVRFTNCL